MGMLSVGGIILNVLVIVVTLKHRQLRQPLNYALVNLAICDLGCALFGGIPTTVTSAMGYFSLGRLGCVLEGFAVAFFGRPYSFSQVTKLHVAEGGSTNRVEVHVARMVVLMVLAFLLTWLPYASMALAVVMDSTLYIDPVTATIPVYLAKSSTVYNPIIYIFMNRQVIPSLITTHRIQDRKDL
ncbi:unnamed protein product [Tetraodon nigroviridis]|uniref:(spotted green pufferfish) hypothetical protein n=1 Tax=Tetraodon nigroviridis TaxID=99883 RepID=Q4RE35_TETNG|nr:unnamed protein product [Tetraodon nigroviridis]